MTATLLTRPFDPELTPGARNAVRVCLAVRPAEKVTIITDEDCSEIAASLAAEVSAVGAPFRAFVLEDEAPRPLTALPAAIAEDMETSQVSIFAVHVQPNELQSRMQMTDIVNRRRMRHAHMVNINKRIMMEGMRADFHKVDRLSTRVLDIVSRARHVRATTPAGSDFSAELNPRYRWLKTSGLISPDKWGNLPGGEVFTELARGRGVRIERIVSSGQASPPGFWYEQAWDEWVLVLAGRALLAFDDGERCELGAGDCVAIAAHRRHRVEWTDPAAPTVWLAVHHGEAPG